ncbi:protein FAM162A isoform X1 [Sciurus carolinensis]|uniref:protein FAM162A isoform X1 n=1 Tax=Sciurus carolinensis TaxID=30640 RepID=UPI001FB4D25E|nr:protein FAM162A isoform X1 [Sciurus carolinensis]
MGSLRGLRLAFLFCSIYDGVMPFGRKKAVEGNFFRLYEKDAASSVRFTTNSNLKQINGFCTKPQENPKVPSNKYSHRVPLHKPTDWERKILIWSGRFKKEDEIPETISFEMLDAAKNKIRVKVSYIMIALTVAGCILMIIEGQEGCQKK